MGSLIKVARTTDVPSGGGIAVDVQGKPVALFQVNGKFYAIEDTCAHAGGPLSEGGLEGTVVTCPWHGATFDVTNGNALSEPAFEGVKSYKVHVDGNDIKIELQ